ncbi:MAG: CHAT domain-containing protein [Segetibacter sp.]
MQQNPMFRSGLVLAGANYAWKGGAVIPGKEDGILTAYEIAQMDLSNTDLVVLSACETALGDLQGNEGVIGLQRAFKMAGVKQLIVSLWRVPDKETTELMTLFYHNWLTGQSTREALRSAQLKMKEKYSPYFWAAFVVVE